MVSHKAIIFVCFIPKEYGELPTKRRALHLVFTYCTHNTWPSAGGKEYSWTRAAVMASKKLPRKRGLTSFKGRLARYGLMSLILWKEKFQFYKR